MSSGSIVKKKGKYYVVSREEIRKLLIENAERVGKEIAEDKIRKGTLVIEA